jgi:peptidoglycan/LPS O-acetylase OafA/YrhL
MVGTPTGFNNASSASTPIVPLWFLTPLIAIGYLYTFLVNRKYNLMMFAAPLIAVLGFTYFTLNSENVLDFYIKMGLFNAGTVRAISEMAMGISLYQLCAYIKKRDWKLPGIIMLQLLELLAIYRYCALTFSAQLSIDNFRRIPYILIIVLLSFANITFLSKLLNRKFMEKLGKISLTMFLIHFPVATAYMWIISTIKRNPAVRSLPGFILRSGGSNSRLQQIPLSLGDLAMYIPFVIAVSVLLNLIVFGIKTARTKRRKRALPV